MTCVTTNGNARNKKSKESNMDLGRMKVADTEI
jgi:hypothetical protein